LFFYAGGKEGESMVPGMQRIRRIFKSGSPSKTEELIDQQAGHNEAAWRKYFPAFYEWTILNTR